MSSRTELERLKRMERILRPRLLRVDVCQAELAARNLQKRQTLELIAQIHVETERVLGLRTAPPEGMEGSVVQAYVDLLQSIATAKREGIHKIDAAIRQAEQDLLHAKQEAKPMEKLTERLREHHRQLLAQEEGQALIELLTLRYGAPRYAGQEGEDYGIPGH